MSRESKRRERLAKRQAYRAASNGRILCTATSETDVQRNLVHLNEQLEALPGKAEEKYVAFLNCGDSGVYSYPIYGCKDGFTAALQDAVRKHQSARRPKIVGGMVKGIGETVFTPPDALVQMIAMGANVLVTNRLQNLPITDGALYGSFIQGSN